MKNETRIKRPRIFYLNYLGPRQSPGVGFPQLLFLRAHGLAGALSLVNPSFTKKVPPGEQFAFLGDEHRSIGSKLFFVYPLFVVLAFNRARELNGKRDRFGVRSASAW
jgi:hypothetical protein